jgi:class 3 adenylate cyclase
MMRLSRELTPDFFDALLSGHHRLLRRLFEEMGGREVEVSGDSALPAFPTAKAGRALRRLPPLTAHEWPHGQRPAISVGLHSGQAGIGTAAARCAQLCDAAEGGQSSCRRTRRICSRTRISAGYRFAIWASSR